MGKGEGQCSSRQKAPVIADKPVAVIFSVPAAAATPQIIVPAAAPQIIERVCSPPAITAKMPKLAIIYYSMYGKFKRVYATAVVDSCQYPMLIAITTPHHSSDHCWVVATAGHIRTLAESIKKGAEEAGGVEVTIWQVKIMPRLRAHHLSRRWIPSRQNSLDECVGYR